MLLSASSKKYTSDISQKAEKKKNQITQTIFYYLPSDDWDPSKETWWLYDFVLLDAEPQESGCPSPWRTLPMLYLGHPSDSQHHPNGVRATGECPRLLWLHAHSVLVCPFFLCTLHSPPAPHAPLCLEPEPQILMSSILATRGVGGLKNACGS